MIIQLVTSIWERKIMIQTTNISYDAIGIGRRKFKIWAEFWLKRSELQKKYIDLIGWWSDCYSESVVFRRGRTPGQWEGNKNVMSQSRSLHHLYVSQTSWHWYNLAWTVINSNGYRNWGVLYFKNAGRSRQGQKTLGNGVMDCNGDLFNSKHSICVATGEQYTMRIPQCTQYCEQSHLTTPVRILNFIVRHFFLRIASVVFIDLEKKCINRRHTTVDAKMHMKFNSSASNQCRPCTALIRIHLNRPYASFRRQVVPLYTHCPLVLLHCLRSDYVKLSDNLSHRGKIYCPSGSITNWTSLNPNKGQWKHSLRRMASTDRGIQHRLGFTLRNLRIEDKLQ